MGCYPVSVVLNGLLPLQRPDQGVFTSSVLWLLGLTPSVGFLYGLYPISWFKNGFEYGLYPIVWFEYGLYPILWFEYGFEYGLYPISWFENRFEYGLYPIGWFEYGFYPISGISFWAFYPHPWFVWRALSPSVVCLKGFTPSFGWIWALPHQLVWK